MKIFMFIMVMLLPAVAVCLLDIYLFNRKASKGKLVAMGFKSLFLLDLMGPAIMASLFGYSNLYNPLKNDYMYLLSLLMIILFIGSIYILGKLILAKHLRATSVSFKNRGGTIALYFIAILLLFFGFIEFFGVAWVNRTYNGVTIDEIFITLTTNTKGTDPKIILSFIEEAVLISIASTYITALVFYKLISNNITLVKNDKPFLRVLSKKVGSTLTGALLFLVGFVYLFIRLDIAGLIYSYTAESSYIEENYVDPKETKLEIPSEKRNLIHIYLESIENSYFDKANGGNMDTNLMPYLLELSKEGYSFSHLGKDEGRGGPLKTNGATWSVASMVNQFFGVPMKVPARRNAYGKSGEFFPGAVGIGDILNRLGYQQTVMFGADADFGGLTYMFEDHGDFKIMDHAYALENHMLPTDDYKVNWGYEDEKLYEFAKAELTRLSNDGKPFHFLMENADTHYPGFAFDKAGKPIWGGNKRDLDYGKTITYSDKMVVEFIRWIMAQPFYKNTTVVIIGDHLSMDKTFFRDNNFGDFHRTTYNLILNPAPALDLSKEDRFYNRKWASFDMMPTILASIGVKVSGERLGLGTNLFSSLPTIYERDGYDEVNKLFKRKSTFYNRELLGKQVIYDGGNLVVEPKKKDSKEDK